MSDHASARHKDSMNRETALSNTVVTALREWAKTAPCKLLIVFGSSARQQTHPRSDVDIGVMFDELPPPERRLSMIGEIQDRCGRARADVVFLRSATDPVLRFEIFRSGIPIHEESPGLFLAETVRALALYEDALPFRRLLSRRLSGAAQTP